MSGHFMYQHKLWFIGLVSLSLVVVSSLRVSLSIAWPSAVGEYRAPWWWAVIGLGEGEIKEAAWVGCPPLFRREQLKKELWKPVEHLFLNDKGSQELL